MEIRSRLDRLERATGARRRVRSFRELSTPELIALLKAMEAPVTRGADGEDDISDIDLEAMMARCAACETPCGKCQTAFQRACDAVGIMFLG